MITQRSTSQFVKSGEASLARRVGVGAAAIRVPVRGMAAADVLEPTRIASHAASKAAQGGTP
ncbi:MAG: hypothetical protein K2Q10_06555 [Rhodospirillales bacterium]|nr:hypothetical protein [Rhodospirillales bacterium]